MIDKLKHSLLNGSDADTHTYECPGCRKQFESTAASAETAACPDCGGQEVRVAGGGRDHF